MRDGQHGPDGRYAGLRSGEHQRFGWGQSYSVGRENHQSPPDKIQKESKMIT